MLKALPKHKGKGTLKLNTLGNMKDRYHRKAHQYFSKQSNNVHRQGRVGEDPALQNLNIGD
jgi:hypothetical protein